MAAAPLVSSHEEVYRVVREKQLLSADELFDLARSRSADGDRRLFLYCAGASGKAKRNLQSTIDVIWASDAGLPGASASRESSHAAPLTAARLSELARLARRAPPMGAAEAAAAKAAPFVKTAWPKALDKITSLTKTLPQGEVGLLDHFRARAEWVIKPRGGTWRLRDFYEMLVVARGEASLAGAFPSLSDEGGISVPRTRSGWEAMLRQGVAEPPLPFAALSAEQLAEAVAEMRFTLSCGSLSWRPSRAAGEAWHQHGWIEEMPKDPEFENDTFQFVPFEERLVRLSARRHVEDHQLLAIFRVAAKLGHTVEQTVGFQVKRGCLVLDAGAKRGRFTTHKSVNTTFGAICAQASVAEGLGMLKDMDLTQRRGKKRGSPMLTSGRSSQARPVPALLAEALLALTAEASNKGELGDQKKQKTKSGVAKAKARAEGEGEGT